MMGRVEDSEGLESWYGFNTAAFGLLENIAANTPVIVLFTKP